MLRYANLALLILFPLAWFAPLLRAGVLPLFGLSEISVITGLQARGLCFATLREHPRLRTAANTLR